MVWSQSLQHNPKICKTPTKLHICVCNMYTLISSSNWATFSFDSEEAFGRCDCGSNDSKPFSHFPMARLFRNAFCSLPRYIPLSLYKFFNLFLMFWLVSIWTVLIFCSNSEIDASFLSFESKLCTKTPHWLIEHLFFELWMLKMRILSEFYWIFMC